MVGFPNVPFAPGVPALPRAPGFVGVVVDLLLADALSIFGDNSSQWGLFVDGVPVVTAESVLSFEFKEGATVATFPVEPPASGGSPGTFESYDKVMRSFDVRLRFSTGGSPEDRQALLDSARAAVRSLDLMDAVTPEATYESVNPTHWDYRRTADRGVGLLVVDIFCEQIQATASTSFTTAQSGASGIDTSTSTTQISVRPAASIVNPQSPSASPQVNGGTVQPVANAPGQFDFPS
ncbi:hypothetical protein LJR220_003330 [Bradyrhizobium sp. LjRoot220]|uniref:hypothetical protein n=1 Tax=Bradyrhizobium sp. LjRoot220 TaxID=3342284 RepID=UPI003ECE65B5